MNTSEASATTPPTTPSLSRSSTPEPATKLAKVGPRTVSLTNAELELFRYTKPEEAKSLTTPVLAPKKKKTSKRKGAINQLPLPLEPAGTQKQHKSQAAKNKDERFNLESRLV